MDFSFILGLSLFEYFIACNISFGCSIDHAKRSFYRAANAVFAKVGSFASEEVILELIL